MDDSLNTWDSGLCHYLLHFSKCALKLLLHLKLRRVNVVIATRRQYETNDALNSHFRNDSRLQSVQNHHLTLPLAMKLRYNIMALNYFHSKPICEYHPANVLYLNWNPSTNLNSNKIVICATFSNVVAATMKITVSIHVSLTTPYIIGYYVLPLLFVVYVCTAARQ